MTVTGMGPRLKTVKLSSVGKNKKIINTNKQTRVPRSECVDIY